MRILLLIGTGGFIGSVGRYLLSVLIQDKMLSSFPFGTLSVNIIGCFLIGALFALSEKGMVSTDWRLFLVTGVCGGFTTFSSFSNETIALMRGGQIGYAFAYVAASLILGLLATFLAITIFKLI
ncbi:MAG TPA: fluoride efflux transporter CrcB [Chitinophagales bacterium]|nr:fluoride efflux transporter CrcB [Chitinophagales bacterium]